MPKRNAPETTAYTIRLTPRDKAWLDQTAQNHGLEVPQVIRMAIEALRQYVQQHGGTLHLPIDISVLWEKALPLLQSRQDPLSARLSDAADTGLKPRAR